MKNLKKKLLLSMLNSYKAHELGERANQLLKDKGNLIDENAELQDKLKNLASVAEVRLANWQKLEKENAELRKELEELREYKMLHQPIYIDPMAQ